MNLKNLLDETLLSQTKDLVSREREITLQVLWYLREVEARRLFAARGFPSLIAYAVHELHYSEASAVRRVEAMRLLKEIPEAEERIQDGTLSLSVVAQAQSFFKKEELTLSEKREILSSLENQTTRQAERTLLGFSSEPFVHLKEKVKPVTQDLSRVEFYADDALLADLEKLKGLLAHSHPGMSTSDLVKYLAELGLMKLDPAQREVRKSTPAPEFSMGHGRFTSQNVFPKTTQTKSTSRYVPTPLKREIYKRDGSQCSWVDQKTGRRCSSQHFLQIDHKIPWALGGETSEKNLRILCFHHNQLERERWFGKK